MNTHSASPTLRTRARASWVWFVLLLPTIAVSQSTTLYTGGRWWTGTDFEEQTVLVRNGVFVDSLDGEPDAVFDLAGGYVIPPLGDAHNHALAGPGPDEQITQFLRQGVYYLANPNNLAALAASVRSKVNVPGSVSVIYSNGGITGPGGHPIPIYERMATQLPDWTSDDMDGQAYFVVDSAAQLDRAWSRIRTQQPDFIKVMLEYSEEHKFRSSDPSYYGRRGLDPDLLAPVIERAHATGLRVVVHVSSAADVTLAVASGADAIAHLPLERIPVATVLEAKGRGVVFTTTLTSHRPTSHIEGLEAIHRHNLDLLLQHDVPMILGTDSERGLLAEMLELTRLSRLTNAEALQLAVSSTPRWIFPQRNIGNFSASSEASFLVLDTDPTADLEALETIQHRVQNGTVLELPAQSEALPSIAQRIAGPLMHEGFDAAVAVYQRLRTAEPNDWDFSEQQLNALGYQLLQHQQIELAIKVFEFNATLFPESANVYDSWGEGLMTAERYEQAIAQYERALAINPHNPNAVAYIESMRAKLNEQ